MRRNILLITLLTLSATGGWAQNLTFTPHEVHIARKLDIRNGENSPNFLLPEPYGYEQGVLIGTISPDILKPVNYVNQDHPALLLDTGLSYRISDSWGTKIAFLPLAIHFACSTYFDSKKLSQGSRKLRHDAADSISWETLREMRTVDCSSARREMNGFIRAVRKGRGDIVILLQGSAGQVNTGALHGKTWTVFSSGFARIYHPTQPKSMYINNYIDLMNEKK
jgi:hypothetical protein